jgi:hypothetical protein
MRRLFVVLLAVSLALIPFLANTGAKSSPSGSAPPIEQPLVREGDFAVKLATSLDLTSTDNEAQAEHSLASVGIGPRNGWIADYPITPDILAEVQDSAGNAADSGKLTVRRDEAIITVQNISTDMGLQVSAAGNRNGYAARASSSEYSENPTDVENYYYDEGPPVVTYYAPPWDYDYLYSWVDWPFWSGGYWFGGFFVLNDFDREGHGHHGHEHAGTGRISNHVRTADGQVGRITAANRLQGNGLGGSSAGTHISGLTGSGTQLGARSIVNHDMDRSDGSRVSSAHSGNLDSFSASPGNTQPRSSERFSTDSEFASPRSFGGPVAHNSVPSMGFHSFSGAFQGGGFHGGSFGGFHGGGGGGFHGGGGGRGR